MHFLVSFLIFGLFSFAALGEQGTLSTDNTEASQAAASMSGYEEQEDVDLREEEVQLQEDDYDPSVDDRPVEVELDQQKMDEYNEEVDSATP